jgi:transposase-like protein
MIQETITHMCRVCKSTKIVKNGTNRCGNPQYHCKDCGTYRILQPKTHYSEAEKQTILQASQERSSLRGIQRVFGVARQIVAQWIKTHAQKLPEMKDILLAATPNDVLELDEVWSFVVKKGQKIWKGNWGNGTYGALEQDAAATCWSFYVRQTLSFSKSDLHHYLFTKSFILQYNLEILLTT